MNKTNKKADSQVTKNKVVVMGGNIGVEEWEVASIGCKDRLKDALYNMGNTANIL